MRTKLIIISLFGATAVALGALGAHALKEILEPTELESYQTAVRYHLFHTLYLFILVALSKQLRTGLPFWLAFIGILFFSGSIYMLVLDREMGINLGFLGPVTPIGGLLLIASWISLGVVNYRSFK